MLDCEIYEGMLEDVTENELEAELDNCNETVKRFTFLRVKLDKLHLQVAWTIPFLVNLHPMRLNDSRPGLLL